MKPTSRSKKHRSKKGSGMGKKEMMMTTTTTATKTAPPCDEYNNVFLGRGGLGNLLRRNSLYRELIVKHYEEYGTLGPKDKRSFARDKIVATIYESGGKFFKEDDAKKAWVEVADESTILDKVMQAFRDTTRKRSVLPRKGESTEEEDDTSSDDDGRDADTTTSSSVGSFKSASSTATSLPAKRSPPKKRRVEAGEDGPDDSPDHVDGIMVDGANIPELGSQIITQDINALASRVKRLEGLVCFLMKENEGMQNRVDAGQVYPV